MQCYIILFFIYKLNIIYFNVNGIHFPFYTTHFNKTKNLILSRYNFCYNYIQLFIIPKRITVANYSLIEYNIYCTSNVYKRIYISIINILKAKTNIGYVILYTRGISVHEYTSTRASQIRKSQLKHTEGL